ncbi:Cysteine-rich receptor-like protein kinase [Arachis hypogaea]|nr:Cysteine-rich receptor-like protein kinase [Arachis hypogaea]
MISSDELLFMNLATIKDATHDFSDSNKLGQGGFGAVYKMAMKLQLKGYQESLGKA